MLHDLARLYPPQVLLAECQARGLPITQFERHSPVVLHAKLGAQLAGELFGVIDAEVVSAIRKHTVAAATMSVLDCLIYLADSLEPGRIFPERQALAVLSFHDVHAAMSATIASAISYLKKRSLPVAPETLAAARTFGVWDRDEEVITAGTT